MASRGFAPALLLLVLLDVSACGSSSDSTSRTSAPEELSSGRVDVGGYQLDWICRGVGSPAVVAEAGYDSPGTDTWVDLLGSVSEISRICTYDRAGTGTSDPRPDGLHVTSLLQAEELHRLLEGAGIEPPYVIVGHSYGGFVSRLFAAKYAAETAGLVLIDVLSVRLWSRTQADLATLSSNSLFVQATGGHFVMNDDPQVVLVAIGAVVASARSSEPLPTCERLIEGTDGTCPLAG